MKEIVDFEQAKQLKEAGILIGEKSYYISAVDCKYFLGCKGVEGELALAPTIGELIEWCKENVEFGMTITPSDNKWTVVTSKELIRKPELIDALVELAIKIKED